MIEDELKLRVCREHFYTVVNAYYLERKRMLLNVYYDTIDVLLYKHDHTLRLRYEKDDKKSPKLQLKLSESPAYEGRFSRREYQTKPVYFLPPKEIPLGWTKKLSLVYNLPEIRESVRKALIEALTEAVHAEEPFASPLHRFGAARTTRYNLKTRAGILEADRVDLPNGQTYFELEYEGDDTPELIDSLRYELPGQAVIDAKTLVFQSSEQTQRQRQQMPTYSPASKYQVFMQQCIL